MAIEQINPGSVIRWSEQAVATEVNEEIVLMNLDRDRCYGLGSTGSDIWRRLQEPIGVGALLLQLEAEYHAAPGLIADDLMRTLQQFASEGLIVIEN
jgi:hypothetical protein